MDVRDNKIDIGGVMGVLKSNQLYKTQDRLMTESMIGTYKRPYQIGRALVGHW